MIEPAASTYSTYMHSTSLPGTILVHLRTKHGREWSWLCTLSLASGFLSSHSQGCVHGDARVTITGRLEDPVGFHLRSCILLDLGGVKVSVDCTNYTMRDVQSGRRSPVRSCEGGCDNGCGQHGIRVADPWKLANQHAIPT